MLWQTWLFHFSFSVCMFRFSFLLISCRTHGFFLVSFRLPNLKLSKKLSACSVRCKSDYRDSNGANNNKPKFKSNEEKKRQKHWSSSRERRNKDLAKRNLAERVQTVCKIVIAILSQLCAMSCNKPPAFSRCMLLVFLDLAKLF